MVVSALVLDQLLGEPRRFHPLVGFGRYVRLLEKYFNRSESHSSLTQMSGAFAWLLAVVPLTLLAWVLGQALGIVADILLLYLAIGRKSLFQHSQRVTEALNAGDLDKVRLQTSMMVSRECAHLDQTACARATVESVLENGSDSIFAALFWFMVLGAPGVVLYRLANTLDAMWGYKNDRYRHFGWASARIDDLLNYLPARICAACYCLAGRTSDGFSSWRRYASMLSSPNGGPVMTAGAGALNVRLGGPARYHGVNVDKPWYGGNQEANARLIVQANRLVDRALIVFLSVSAVTIYSLNWLF